MTKKILVLILAAATLVVPTLAVTTSTASAADGPTIVERRSIGHSVEGRTIWAWHLGDPTSRKTIVLMAAMHGNETSSSATLRALRDGRPITGANVWVIPEVNPDGVAHHSRRNAHGVDLNRNFSTGWKKIRGATNSGSKAFSEPETRAIRDFVLELRPEYSISYHQPLDGIDIRDTGNDKWAKRLASEIRLRTTALDCDSSCHGTYSMWFRKHVRSGAVVTVELTSHPSRKYLTRVAPRAVLRSIHARR